MQCSLTHLPTHSPSRRLRDIFLTIAISLAWMPLFQCLIENPFPIYIEQTNALLVLRCIIMFSELSVCFGKIVSLQSCHVNVSFFAGISYSENAFHPEHFLSVLCTSSGGQSKYFEILSLSFLWVIGFFRTKTVCTVSINTKTISFWPNKSKVRSQVYPPSLTLKLLYFFNLTLAVSILLPAGLVHKN